MERKKHFRWDRLLECVLWVGVTAFLMWVAVSYCDVITHNCEECPTYRDWNLFNLMF